MGQAGGSLGLAGVCLCGPLLRDLGEVASPLSGTHVDVLCEGESLVGI